MGHLFWVAKQVAAATQFTRLSPGDQLLAGRWRNSASFACSPTGWAFIRVAAMAELFYKRQGCFNKGIGSSNFCASSFASACTPKTSVAYAHMDRGLSLCSCAILK